MAFGIKDTLAQTGWTVEVLYLRLLQESLREHKVLENHIFLQLALERNKTALASMDLNNPLYQVPVLDPRTNYHTTYISPCYI
jgi:hypothetical protein